MKRIVLLALAALCHFQYKEVFGHHFKFNDLGADQLQALNGKWELSGTVKIDRQTASCVKRKLDIQVVDNVCAVNLGKCSTTKLNQQCYCIKQTGKDYSIRLQPTAKSAHSGLNLQATMSSKKGSTNVGRANVGQIPTITGSDNKNQNIQVSVEVNGGGKIDATKNTVLAICNGQMNRVQVCVHNKSPKAKLRISINGEETSTNKQCVTATEHFDLVANPSASLNFIHEGELGWDEFVFTTEERKFGCRSSLNAGGIGFESKLSRLSVPIKKSNLSMTEVCTDTTPGTCENEIQENGLLLVRANDGKMVLCDTIVDEGRWTLIQRRKGEEVNFYRDWADYVEGFGSYPDEMWFGLENLYQLCKKECQLRFDLGGVKGYAGNYWAVYKYFKVLGAEHEYEFEVSGYNGTAGDSFSEYSGAKFQARDKDAKSGRWFKKNADSSNINGLFGPEDTVNKLNAYWFGIGGHTLALSYTEMKVRPLVPWEDVCTTQMDKDSADRVLVTRPDGGKVACELKTNGGGWTIIQRRDCGDIDFFRTFADYRDGFGNVAPNGTFWWGLEKINQVCKPNQRCELRFDMTYKGNKYWAQYRYFVTEKHDSNYVLYLLNGYKGKIPMVTPLYDFSYREEAPNSNKVKFSTMDKDNDGSKDKTINCGKWHHGGWWYSGDSCSDINPNGDWGEQNGLAAMRWKGITTLSDSLDFIEMKVRPLSVDGRFKPLIRECYHAGLTKDGDTAMVTPVDGPHKDVSLLCLWKGARNWTMIQQRVNDDVDFNRTYVDYIRGFGDVSRNGSFWIGLDHIVEMCNYFSQCKLVITFGFQGGNYTLSFKTFYLYGQPREYKIHVKSEDSMTASQKAYINDMNDQYFSTYSFFGAHEESMPKRQKCALEGGGGWWYRYANADKATGCLDVNPNGVFNSIGDSAVKLMAITDEKPTFSFVNFWVTNIDDINKV